MKIEIDIVALIESPQDFYAIALDPDKHEIIFTTWDDIRPCALQFAEKAAGDAPIGAALDLLEMLTGLVDNEELLEQSIEVKAITESKIVQAFTDIMDGIIIPKDQIHEVFNSERKDVKGVLMASFAKSLRKVGHVDIGLEQAVAHDVFDLAHPADEEVEEEPASKEKVGCGSGCACLN